MNPFPSSGTLGTRRTTSSWRAFSARLQPVDAFLAKGDVFLAEVPWVQELPFCRLDCTVSSVSLLSLAQVVLNVQPRDEGVSGRPPAE